MSTHNCDSHCWEFGCYPDPPKELDDLYDVLSEIKDILIEIRVSAIKIASTIEDDNSKIKDQK